jgi:hypothetical protein
MSGCKGSTQKIEHMSLASGFDISEILAAINKAHDDQEDTCQNPRRRDAGKPRAM